MSENRDIITPLSTALYDYLAHYARGVEGSAELVWEIHDEILQHIDQETFRLDGGS